MSLGLIKGAIKSLIRFGLEVILQALDTALISSVLIGKQCWPAARLCSFVCGGGFMFADMYSRAWLLVFMTTSFSLSGHRAWWGQVSLLFLFVIWFLKESVYFTGANNYYLYCQFRTTEYAENFHIWEASPEGFFPFFPMNVFFSISWEFFLIWCEVLGQGCRMCQIVKPSEANS